MQQYVKAENNKYGFLEKFIKQYGIPFWDNAMLYRLPAKMTGRLGRGQSDDTSYLAYIPMVQDSQNHVGAQLIIKATPSDTVYQFMSESEYDNYGFNHNADSLLNGLKVFSLFANHEKNVFGHTKFRILDNRILQGQTNITCDVGKQYMVELDTLSSSGRPMVMSGPPPLPNSSCILVNEMIASGYAVNYTMIGVVCVISSYGLGEGDPSGGGGGGGGGGGWVPVEPEIPPPCDPYIGTLQNDATFKEKFMSLNGTAATGSSVEKGFAVFDRANGNYVAKEGLQHNPEIDWRSIIVPGSLIDGLLHSHFQGYNNIFSPRDLLTMAEIFVYGYAKDPNNLFFGMTSNTGIPYLIKVSNPTIFLSFAQNILAMETKNDGFTTAYNDKLNSGDNTKNVKEFFKMLKDQGGLAGLSVYEAVPDNSSNYNFDQWKRLNWNINFEDFDQSTNCF